VIKIDKKIIRDIFGFNYTQVMQYPNQSNYAGMQKNVCRFCGELYGEMFRNRRGYLQARCDNPRCQKYKSLQYIKE
jgi:anaerobic ribonucleoside-triphosphate reductase